jgi:hypothetical protein
MNNIPLIVIITLLFAFALTYSRMYVKLLKAKKELSKLAVNVIVLEEYINGIEENKIQSDESIHKENFIKFLSDSRDWAYSYIEEVQDGLSVFFDSVDQDIQHFDEYGDVLSTNRPDYDSMKRISEAYKKLKTLLPEELNDKT